MTSAQEYFQAKWLVEKLGSMSRSGANPHEFVPLLQRMLHFLPLTAIPIQNPNLFRARLNEQDRLFTNTAELAYPPPDRVKTKGRLNDLHESIFYGALCELGCIIETKPSIGQLFTIATTVRRDTTQVLLFPIGIRDREFSPKGETKIHRLFVDWLQDELIKSASTPDEYNSTIGISKFFLHKEIDWDQGERLSGIIYPSVPGRTISNVTTFNVAMQPSLFDRNFRINKAEVYCLTHEPDQYCLQSLNTGEVCLDGTIDWVRSYEEMIERALHGISGTGDFSPYIVEAFNGIKINNQ